MCSLDLTFVHVPAAAFVTPFSKSTVSDCATSPSMKDKTGDDLIDVDSDPDLVPGRFSSLVSISATLGQMTSSGLSVENSALLQAINSSLGSRIDTANSQLASMNHRMINKTGGGNMYTNKDGRLWFVDFKCLVHFVCVIFPISTLLREKTLG